MFLHFWWLIWPALKAGTHIVISLTALFFTFRDRRPRMVLRARKGDWCKLTTVKVGNKTVMFRGIVEAYNVSARANAIRGYGFHYKIQDGKWQKMDGEFTVESVYKDGQVKSNVTPVTLAPYSGIELSVLAFAKMPQPCDMQVRIEVEDIFGKLYQVEVKAVS